MGSVALALIVGGMALIFSGLIFFIPFRGRRPAPRESFEDSQERLDQHLREMRRSRSEMDV